jgi:hypothetical protein
MDTNLSALVLPVQVMRSVACDDSHWYITDFIIHQLNGNVKKLIIIILLLIYYRIIPDEFKYDLNCEIHFRVIIIIQNN